LKYLQDFLWLVTKNNIDMVAMNVGLNWTLRPAGAKA